MGDDSPAQIAGQVEGPAEAALRIQLLGGFRVWVQGQSLADDGWRRRKAAALLKLLALSPDHRLHREQLLELLWPEMGVGAAVNNLHRTLHLLRHLLEPSLPAGASSSYLCWHGEQLLLCSSVWVDVSVFQAAALAARQSRRPIEYERALALYPGELLPEDRYEDWAAGPRERLRGMELSLLKELEQLYERQADEERAIRTWERLVEREPVDEEGRTRLMRLLALTNQRHRALQQYQQLRDALRLELGVEPQDATRRLYREILAGSLPPHRTHSSDPATSNRVEEGAKQPPKLSSPDVPAGNLPSRVSSFIGREEEVEELRSLLEVTRLLTLTGAGGCGKTRLGLEVAARYRGQSGKGAWLVELAALSEGAAVPQAVASALQLREEPGRPVRELLLHALRPRSLLLVLDNCEHLLDACARLTEELLAACPDVRVLITSRQGLRINGELTWRVPSLEVPDPSRMPPLDRLERYDAIRLFLERARVSQRGLQLDEQTAGAIVQICRQVDGIPLAIELAAVRLSVLSLEQLEQRLDDCFALLRTGSRTALPRQQTLEATMDWSHDLLTGKEQVLFRRLGVFAGGWRLEGAEAIGAGGEVEQADVLDLLFELVDKSLVVTEQGAGGVRYRFLEPVRQYAVATLRAAGEEEERRRQHARWCVQLAETAEPELVGVEQADWLERLDREHDNLRAAVSWTLSSGESALAIRLTAALWRFWYGRGYLQEGYAWLTRALSQPAPSGADRARARALNAAGVFAYWQSGAEEAGALFGEALVLGRRTGDSHATATSLANLGMVTHYRGEYERAAEQYGEALDLSRQLGDTRLVAICLNNLGTLAKDRGDRERALLLSEESLSLFRQIGDRHNAAGLLSNLGALAAELGDDDRAERLCAESVNLLRAMGNKLGLTQALESLSTIVERRGDNEQAAVLLEEALALSRQLTDAWGTAAALGGLARLAREAGDFARATSLGEESLRLHREVGYKQGAAASLLTLADIARDQAEPSRAAALYKESLELYREVGDKQGADRCLQHVAEIGRAPTHVVAEPRSAHP